MPAPHAPLGGTDGNPGGQKPRLEPIAGTWRFPTRPLPLSHPCCLLGVRAESQTGGDLVINTHHPG